MNNLTLLNGCICRYNNNVYKRNKFTFEGYIQNGKIYHIRDNLNLNINLNLGYSPSRWALFLVKHFTPSRISCNGNIDVKVKYNGVWETINDLYIIIHGAQIL
jgi:hypothetical protein